MTKTNELRVFISSTFHDLQEEREHLVKKIFPEIRALCRQRGITFTEVDLRWGLTEEDAILGQVIRTCLEEVDKCRPYFIGMIGNRYGWVPEFHEILMDPDLLAKYPWIEEVALEGASVTEMEFIHGVFDALPAEGEYAFFYHREDSKEQADDPERLAALIERARSTGHPFRDFRTIDELGQQVHDDLIEMIDRYWPETEAPTPLELERRAHTAFSASRVRAYIPNPTYLKEFSRWTNEGEKPLVVHGESGLGKSSLVAYLTEYFKKKNREALIVEHYVGASDNSGSAVRLMRYIVEEICERFSIDEQLPSTQEELEKSFPNWLFRAEHLAQQANISILIVIDAVNQLGEYGRRLAWLPKTIPAGIKLLTSTTPGEAEDRLLEREWDAIQVVPLEDERVRQSIVVRYLGEFKKSISPNQLRLLTEDPKASSPLYLRVVAEELRLYGEHETIDEQIARYTEATDLLEVFERVLERVERDYGEAAVRDLLSLIGASRSGLNETELLGLTGVNRLELSRLLFAFDYHLVRKNGLLSFFHDYLRRAVQKRYLFQEEVRRERHTMLAAYFRAVESTVRVTLELMHALELLGEHKRVRGVLAEINRFVELWGAGEQEEILRRWSGSEPAEIAEAYREGLGAWQDHYAPSAERRAVVLAQVANLLDRLGVWGEAEALQGVRLEILRELGDRTGESEALSSLSTLALQQGQMKIAQQHAIEAEGIAREIGDKSSIATALGNRGKVYGNFGEYAEALVCFVEQEQMTREIGGRRRVAEAVGNCGIVYMNQGAYTDAVACFSSAEQVGRELGDRSIIAHSVGSRGLVHFHQGKHAEALACFIEQEQITRELGDRRNIVNAVNNRGTVHNDRGEYVEALACHEEAERIARELGDRRSVAGAVGHRGAVHFARGEHQQAIVCLKEREHIARELGDRRGVALAVGNCGGVHSDCGEYAEALACYQQATEEHRAINFLYGVCTWLKGVSSVLVMLSEEEGSGSMPEYLAMYLPPNVNPEHWQQAALQFAREAAEECLAISQTLSKPDTLFGSRIVLARIEAAEGNNDTARQQLQEMLVEVSEAECSVQVEELCAELHYCLWKIEDTDSVRTKGGAEALKLYQTLYEKRAKYEYAVRIEELQKQG